MKEKRGLSFSTIYTIIFFAALIVLLFILVYHHVQYWWAWVLLFGAPFLIQGSSMRKVIKHQLKVYMNGEEEMKKYRDLDKDFWDKLPTDFTEAKKTIHEHEDWFEQKESLIKEEFKKDTRKTFSLYLLITIVCAGMAAFAFVHPAFYQEGYHWTPSDTSVFIIVFLSFLILSIIDWVLVIKHIFKD